MFRARVFVHYVSCIAQSCILFCKCVCEREFARVVACLCSGVIVCVCVFACEKEENKERRQ